MVAVIFSYIYFAIKCGISFDRLTLPNFKAEKLYIKFDNKLILSAKTIHINSSHKKNVTNKKVELLNSHELFNIVDAFYNHIEKIDILKLTMNNSNIEEITYSNSQQLSLLIDTQKLKIALNRVDDSFTIISNNLYFKKRAFSLKLKSVISKDSSYLTLNVKNKKIALNTTLFGKLNENIEFKIRAKTDVTNISPIVDLFGLDSDLRNWVDKYGVYERAELKLIYAKAPVNNFTKLFDSLYIVGIAKGVAYTFQEGFEPIYADNVKILFKDKTLSFYPDANATFYGQIIADSDISIKFEEPLFSLLVKFNTYVKLDNHIQDLIESYDVELPIKDTKGIQGEVQFNLDLIFDTLDVELLCNVDLNESIVDIADSKFDLHAGNVLITTKDISINKLIVADGQNYVTLTNGLIDFVKEEGSLKIDVTSSKLPLSQSEHVTLLNSDELKLSIKYDIFKKNQTLEVTPSKWKVFNEELYIKPFILHSNTKNSNDFALSELKLPPTEFFINNTISGKVNGDISIGKNILDFKVDIDKFTYKTITLKDDSLKLNILNNNTTLTISNKKKSNWNINEFNITLDPIHINKNEEYVNLETTHVDIEALFHSDLSAKYSLEYDIYDLSFKNSASNSNDLSFKNLKSEELNVTLTTNFHQTFLYIQSLALAGCLFNDRYEVHLHDLNKSMHLVPFFKEYHLDHGSAVVSSLYDIDAITFDIDLEYPYNLLVKNNKSFNNYSITAAKIKDQYFFSIEDSIYAEYKNDLTINSKDIGFNLIELNKIISDLNSTSNSNTTLEFNIDSKSSILQINDERSILFDELNIYSNKDMIDLNLTYHNSKANMQIDGEKFELVGEDFDDSFMNALSSLADFHKGKMNFGLYGSFSDYDGYINVDETTLKNYVGLNNLLAFINTIPSLLTFSVPEYNSKGLDAKRIDVTFEAKNGEVRMNTLYLDSEELNILGEGRLNYRKDDIDILIELKTDVGSSLNKIPLIGYVILGDNNSTVSTIVNIDGNLSDPTVTTNLTKDLITAPLNILGRILLLPFKILGLSADSNSTHLENNFEDSPIPTTHF